jgi:hypothetical protein
VKPLTEIKANLAFTCAHENIPEASAETDVLFKYARWLQKNNQLIPDKTVDVEIERLDRISAENGHYKANIKLNEILPLPPAKLPVWDGKLQWLEERLANVPPEKPSDALINQLAKAMVLDPATGKPMPGSPSFSETNILGPTCSSGEACLQSGYWKITWSGYGGFYQLVESNTDRYFSQGEIMPMALVDFYQKGLWPLFEKYRQRHKEMTWGLLG